MGIKQCAKVLAGDRGWPKAESEVSPLGNRDSSKSRGSLKVY